MNDCADLTESKLSLRRIACDATRGGPQLQDEESQAWHCRCLLGRRLAKSSPAESTLKDGSCLQHSRQHSSSSFVPRSKSCRCRDAADKAQQKTRW